MEQIEQAVMYALGPQVEPTLKAQVRFRLFIRVNYVHLLNAFAHTRLMNTASKSRTPTMAGNCAFNCL